MQVLSLMSVVLVQAGSASCVPSSLIVKCSELKNTIDDAINAKLKVANNTQS